MRWIFGMLEFEWNMADDIYIDIYKNDSKTILYIKLVLWLTYKSYLINETKEFV